MATVIQAVSNAIKAAKRGKSGRGGSARRGGKGPAGTGMSELGQIFQDSPQTLFFVYCEALALLAWDSVDWDAAGVSEIPRSDQTRLAEKAFDKLEPQLNKFKPELSESELSELGITNSGVEHYWTIALSAAAVANNYHAFSELAGNHWVEALSDEDISINDVHDIREEISGNSVATLTSKLKAAIAKAKAEAESDEDDDNGYTPGGKRKPNPQPPRTG